MDDIAGLRAGRMPVGLGPGHQDDAATPKVADPDVVIAVNGNAPRHVERVVAGEAHRRGLGAVRADHVHHAGSHFGIAGKELYHVRGGDLKLLHDGHAVGNDRWREVRGHVARHPEIPFRVQSDAADADPDPEGFHLGWIVRRETARPCPTGSC